MSNERKAGAILSYASMGATSLVQFLYVPLLFHFLPKEIYGIYQLTGSLIAYFSVMDFGFSTTIVRYYAKYKAEGDQKSIENMLAIFSMIYSCITLLLLFLGTGLYFYIDQIYSGTLSIYELDLFKSMYVVVLFNMAISLMSNIFKAVINGEERFIFLRGSTLIPTLLRPVMVILVFLIDVNPLYLVWIDTFCNVIVIAASIWYAVYKLHMRIRLYQWNFDFVRQLWGFSFFVFINMIADQFYWRTGQLVLGAVSGAAAVALYAIAMQFVFAYMNFSVGISSVFLPRLTALVSLKEKGKQEINQLFIKIGRIQFYIMALIYSGFILFGKSFISLWIGSGFEQVYILAVIIMGALFIPLIQNLGISILQAMNQHAFRAYVFTFMASLNFVCMAPVARVYGIIGCAVLTSICLVIGNVFVVNWFYDQRVGLDIRAFYANIIRIMYPVMIYTMFIYFFGLGEAASFIELLWKGILYIAGYVLVIWKFSFNFYERTLFDKVLNKFWMTKYTV